jgi:hypothetical protein
MANQCPLNPRQTQCIGSRCALYLQQQNPQTKAVVQEGCGLVFQAVSAMQVAASLTVVAQALQAQVQIMSVAGQALPVEESKLVTAKG